MRLTKKCVEGYIVNPDDKELIKLVVSNDYKCREILMNKLGQLEDIEEEIGIDLITLFEILKSENIYANGKRYDNSNSLSYMGNYWLIFNHQAKQGFRFKDYGKTWAFTKEELL